MVSVTDKSNLKKKTSFDWNTTNEQSPATVFSSECVLPSTLTDVFFYVSRGCPSCPTKSLKATSGGKFLESKKKFSHTRTVPSAQD